MARSKQKPVKKRWRKKKPKILPPEEEKEDGIVLLVRQRVSAFQHAESFSFSACFFFLRNNRSLSIKLNIVINIVIGALLLFLTC